jgi:DNA-directed RNA polymerase
MDNRELLLLQISSQLNHMSQTVSKGRQSAFKKVLLGADSVRTIAEDILDFTISALSKGTALTSTASSLASRMNVHTQFNLKSGTSQKAEATMISAGVEALGSLGSLGYTQVVTESQGVMKLNRLDFKNESNLLFKYFQEIKQVSPIDLPQEEYKGWTHPYKNGVSIVKKMPSELSKKYLYKRMPKVYDALNSYGSTAFVVNEELLDIVKEFDKNDHSFIPPTVLSETVSESLKSLLNFKRTSEFVGRQAKKWYLENVSYQLLKKGLTVAQIDGRSNTYKKRKASGWMKDKSSDALDIVRASSKRYEFDRVIDMATLMQGKAFYYDFQLDSRGRFYPIVNYFEPTGSDLAKSLLMFNHGVAWSDNVERALAIHTANCAGEDKISLDDRVLWTYVWMDEILKASEDPYNSEWLEQFSTDKKTKFQLISACLEWKRLEEQGRDDYMCHLPIGLDATNSGLQILSAMTRDRSGAEETNVIRHPNKEIGDAYMVIARSVLDNGFSYKEFENLGDKAWRKLCKRPTMSYYYDAGKGCIQDQTFEDRRDHGYPLLSEMTYDDSSYIGTAIFDGVKMAFPRQTVAKDLLKRAVCGYIESNPGSPMVTWKTATGFTAFQNYAKTSIKRVNCMFASRPVKLSYQVFLNEARKTDHERGISANFVHSQDASLLALVIARLAELGVSDFMMIHDQFSVNAENMELLLSVFKEVFKEIFEVDQLGNTLVSLGVVGVGVSDYGDLDLEEVLNSKYIIS